QRSEALTKVEGWVRGARRITKENYARLKEMTDWFVNSIYLQRTEALQRCENLIFAVGLDSARTTLYRESAGWMINSVYLQRSEAVETTEKFVVSHGMTKSLFRDLVREYESLVSRGTNRAEALKQAARKVLNAS